MSRADAERTPYTIRRREGRFEVREYPALPLATTSLDADRDDAAFRRLLRFTDRGNARRERIPMTTPVLIDRQGAGPGTMSFVMPERLRAEGPPAPADDQVRLETRPAQQVAVYRYTGRTRERFERDAIGRLRAWVRTQGLAATGDPVVAYYDAPVVLPFLRRNEVMLAVRSSRPGPDA
jgi:hypothetical protein